jgi:hypothetical protein
MQPRGSKEIVLPFLSVFALNDQSLIKSIRHQNIQVPFDRCEYWASVSWWLPFMWVPVKTSEIHLYIHQNNHNMKDSCRCGAGREALILGTGAQSPLHPDPIVCLTAEWGLRAWLLISGSCCWKCYIHKERLRATCYSIHISPLAIGRNKIRVGCCK